MLLAVLFFQSLAVQFSRTIPVKGFFRFPLLSLTRDLYIISYLEAFVKRFCKRFLSFFELACFSHRSFKTIRSLLADLDIISYFQSLVKGFFKSFFDFFQPPARRLRLADSLYSIPYLFRFVKSLFDIFSVLA